MSRDRRIGSELSPLGSHDTLIRASLHTSFYIFSDTHRHTSFLRASVGSAHTKT